MDRGEENLSRGTTELRRPVAPRLVFRWGSRGRGVFAMRRFVELIPFSAASPKAASATANRRQLGFGDAWR